MKKLVLFTIALLGLLNLSRAQSNIAVTSPNGGENWAVGSTQNITWLNSAPFTTVQVEYSTNAGSTWSNVIASTPAGGSFGNYSWLIPNTISNQCLVRVNAGGLNTDVSNANFNIVAPTPSIMVTSPNGGQNWTVGTTQMITWNNMAPFSTVQIEYSTNAGSTWSNVVTSTPAGGSFGNYNWTIPNTLSSQCLVRVNAGGPNIDVSSSTFSISAPVSQLTVSAPNGGENWSVGSTQLITWQTSAPITTVSIEYSINNGSTYSTVIASTPNGGMGGSYNWTIPNTISNQCLVRVNGGGINTDVSNAIFNITAPVSLLFVSAPNGGENWAVGSTQVVTWQTTAPISTVSIEYSINNGSTYSTVIASTPSGVGGGTYNWAIPNTISNQCLVRVNGGGANIDVSNANFNIVAATPSIMVTSPNGGQNWTVGTTQMITWNNMAPFSTVQIEYSTNAGSTWSNVVTSTPAGGSFGNYNWTIPNTLSSQCLVRVNAGGPNIDASNATFTISAPVSQLTVTAPNGGENWIIGSTQLITWQTSAPITTVSIEYSINNGSTYSTVIASTPNGGMGGFYNWTIPNNASSQCLIRVNGGGINTDVSNANFSITNSIGLNEYTKSTFIFVFPNPATNYLQISGLTSIEGVTCHVVDVLGKTVLQTQGNTVIDISSLNKGVYFLQLKGNNSIQFVKFIKE